MIFNGTQLASATGGRLLFNGPAGAIQTDSRRLAPGAWFLALKGERFDGHAFVSHALAAGCAGVIVEHLPSELSQKLAMHPDTLTGGILQVPDTLDALHSIAAFARTLLTGPVIGITGSAGKTSTRVMVVEVLRSLGQVHHTVGNLNNHIGLPMTLLAAPPDTDAMVLEMGMNHPGEIELLSRIARPTVRLITNVGAAHVEGCGSIAGVALAKQELLDGAQYGDIICINLDDEWIPRMPVPEGTQVITYGSHPQAQVRLLESYTDPLKLQTRIRIETPTGKVRSLISTPGQHLALNATAATAVAFALGVPAEAIEQGIARFVPEGMRNRVVLWGPPEAPHRILDDAYNANPISMAAGLQTLKSMPGPRLAVLGDMLELGTVEHAAHQQVLQLAQSLDIAQIFVCGDRFAAAAVGTPVQSFASVEELSLAVALFLQQASKSGQTVSVLLKGSRGARMERVLELLKRNGQSEGGR